MAAIKKVDSFLALCCRHKNSSKAILNRLILLIIFLGYFKSGKDAYYVLLHLIDFIIFLSRLMNTMSRNSIQFNSIQSFI